MHGEVTQAEGLGAGFDAEFLVENATEELELVKHPREVTPVKHCSHHCDMCILVGRVDRDEAVKLAARVQQLTVS